MPQYTPKLPDEEVNYDKEHPLKDLFSMLILVLLGMGILLLSLDYSMRFIGNFIDLKTEAKLFNKMSISMSKSSSKEKIIKEKIISEFVNQLWKPFDQEKGIQFNPEIVGAKEPNAFMMIGGKISLTTGLLQDLKTLNGLGFVVCHELGHFYHRHVIRRMGRALGLSLILYFIGFGDLKKIINFTVQSFTRKDESEADAFAIDCVQNRFGHLEGFDEFFKLIKNKEGFFDKLPFLSTHPVTQDRIDAIELLTIQKGFSRKGPVEEFHYFEKKVSP